MWRSEAANRVVLVPLDSLTVDFGTRVYQLLNDLAEVTGEPEDEALAALLAKSPH